MFGLIRNASFRLKVVLAPLCAIACLLAVGFIGYTANNSLSGSLVDLGEVRVPKIVRAAELDQQLRSIHILVNQSLAWEGAGFKAAHIDELDRSIQQQMTAYEQLLNRTRRDERLDPFERQTLQTMAGEFAKYRKSATEALEIKTGMLGNAVFYMTTMEGTFKRLHAAVDDLIEHESSLSRDAVEEARSLAARNLRHIVAALALALAAAVATAWLMASAVHADFREKNQALVQAYRAIEEASLTDPLTGLRNRRFLEQQLDADISLCHRRYHEWLKAPEAPLPLDADMAFFLVDIDHFKSLNDTYGHAAGDKVLAEMRGRLQDIFRESDYLVRWGGEEFLVVARETNRAEAERLAERIRVSVGGRPFELAPGVAVTKTCSVGFACLPFLPRDPEALNWLKIVEIADHALYMAKRDGRDRWFGLLANPSTRFEDVNQWLLSDPKDAAIKAGMSIACRPASARAVAEAVA
ncbi:diguanylate cyclase [Piscinibacter sp. HJYY11]|uniref:GGDEF domain-containing protein n=1 Tax=Piscinibacter sp. HJYY11 TaxID=2801333 RepID=UPI00192035EE|nr:diguanylate cyclase [Piscinibacter sp. HJYY11]MBL0729888.1 diguanylate cyclase [Piscinibacter sp. HJYY11]